MQARLLVIGDDPLLSEDIRLHLEQAGHRVFAYTDCLSGLEAARRLLPDAAILDVSQPTLASLGVLLRLLVGHPVPVLMLGTGEGTADDRKVLCRSGGCRLSKPFRPAELVQRVNALLMGVDRLVRPVRIPGELMVDPATCEATYRGRSLALTLREAQLLHALVSAPNCTFSRRQLRDQVWGDSVSERTVDIVVSRLRRKLTRVVPAEECFHVQTIWGIGYRLRVDGEES